MTPLATAPEATEMGETDAVAGVAGWDPRAELGGLAVQVRATVSHLDPDAMLASQAPELWDLCDEMSRVLDGAKIMLARRVADTGVHHDAGVRDTAEYLALRSGVTKQATGKMLATSNRLRRLPVVETAVRRGGLSLEQAHLVADAAEADPGQEARLVEFARGVSLKELRDQMLRTKAAADPSPEETRRRQHEERHFRQGTGADGRWWFRGQGKPEDRSRFEAALNPFVEDEFQRARAEGRKESRDRLAYDALQHMATEARRADPETHGVGPTSPTGSGGEGPGATDPEASDVRPTGPTGPGGDGPVAADPDSHSSTGDDTAAGSAGNSSGHGGVRPVPTSAGRRRRGSSLSLLPVLRVELAALHRGHLFPGELCEITSQGPVTVAAARELLDESIVKLVLTNAGEAVTVAHIGRAPPDATHLAILHTDMTDHVARPAGPGEAVRDIAGLGPVPAAAARQDLGELAGVSLLDQVCARGLDVAGLVHRGRQPTVAQRVGLLWSQPACSVQGCPHTFTQIDHRREWSAEQVTELANLDRLCSHHHSLKTHHDYQLVPGTGDRALVSPDDPRHPVRLASRDHDRASPEAA